MISERSVISVSVRLFLFLAFAAGSGICIYLISSSDLTNREAALLGVLVTIASVLASWIITDIYATSQYRTAIKEVKDEHTKNLRTYALKAAEKVNNLSSELSKLTVYLEEELNYTEYRNADEELLAKEERIESAIHLIRALKSINDTGLSDWEGVIGDELDQQREEQEEKANELKEMMARVEAAIEGQRAEVTGARQVRREIDGLRRDLRLAMTQLNETSIPKRLRNRLPKQAVTLPCPSCSNLIDYRQRASKTSFKVVTCSSCSSKSLATYSEESGFQLKARQPEPVTLPCIFCKEPVEALIDNMPNSNSVATCPACTQSFRLWRTMTGAVEGRLVGVSGGPTLAIKEAILDQVRAAMPAQPWPKGAHLKVAEQMGLPPKTVHKAVSELIRRGVFAPQVDGVLLTRVTPAANADAAAEAVENGSSDDSTPRG